MQKNRENGTVNFCASSFNTLPAHGQVGLPFSGPVSLNKIKWEYEVLSGEEVNSHGDSDGISVCLLRAVCASRHGVSLVW